MIKFDITKITMDYVLARRVTTALGGSITVVDPDRSTGNNEVLTRIAIPYAVARDFMKRNKGKANYLISVPCCVVRYDGEVIHVEKKSYVHELNDGEVWSSTAEYAINRMVAEMVKSSDRWYTDGVSLYELPQDAFEHNSHDALTATGEFRGVNVKAIKFKHLSDLQLVQTPTTLSLVSFLPKGASKPVLSPPIWVNVLDASRMKISMDKFEQNTQQRGFKFDVFDKMYLVNINFVLAAGTKIGATFGYNEIGPLQLDKLMVELNTVNLPRLSSSMKQIYDTNQRFIFMLAWLMGFQSRCTNLQQFATVRSLIKQLTTKGIYSRNKVTSTMSIDPPPIIDREQAVANIKTKLTPLQLAEYYVHGTSTLSQRDNEAIQQAIVGVEA